MTPATMMAMPMSHNACRYAAATLLAAAWALATLRLVKRSSASLAAS